MNVLRSDLTANIQQKIEYCDKKISQNPFEAANKRVLYLAENPCLTGKYYLNAIYNNTQICENDDIDQRKKYLSPLSGNINLQNNNNFNFRVEIRDEITTKTFMVKDTGIFSQNLEWVEQKEKEPKVSVSYEIKTFDNFLQASEFYKSVTNLEYEETQGPKEVVKDGKKIEKHHKKTKKIYIDAQNQIINFTKEKIAEFNNTINGVSKTYWNTGIFNDKISNKNQDINQSIYDTDWEYYNTTINIQTESLGKNNSPNQNFIYENKEVLDAEKFNFLTQNDNISDNTLKKEVSNLIYTQPIYVDITKICENFMGKLKNTKEAREYYIHDELFNDFWKTDDVLVYLKLDDYNKEYIKLKQKAEEQKSNINILTNTNIITMRNKFKEIMNIFSKYKKYILPGGLVEKYLKILDTIEETDKNITTAYNSGYGNLLSKRNQLSQAIRSKKNEAEIKKINDEIKEIQNSITSISLTRLSEIIDISPLFNHYSGEQTYIHSKLYDLRKDAYNKAVENSTFNAEDVKITVTVNFVPKTITEYFDFQNIDSSYVKSQLEEKMKKLIKEQNVAKKALTDAEIRSYKWNTKIKPQRDKLEQQLIYIKTLIEQDEENIKKIEKKYNEARITELLNEKANVNSNNPRAITAYEQQNGTEKYLEKIESEIQVTTQWVNYLYKLRSHLNKLKEQETKTNQSIYEIDTTYSHVDIEENSNEKTIYEKRDAIENQISVLQLQLEKLIELRRKQTQINQDIVTYSNNQLKLIYDKNNPNNKQQYIDTIANQEIRQKYQEIYRLTEQGYTINDWQMVKLINEIEAAGYSIYVVDNVMYNQAAWENAQDNYLDYMNQIEDPKNGYDATIEKITQKNTQLENIKAQIKELESQDIATNYEIDEYGVTKETGYTFSSTGLYKNLYIDTKPTNDWIEAKQQLQVLLNRYDSELPEEVQEPRASHMQATSDGNGGIKVVEEKKDEDCKCNWWIPMNFDVFGLKDLLTMLGLNAHVYKTDPETGERIKDKNGKFKVDKRQMAVMDGYGYIYTGKNISLTYTGLPTLPAISVLIPGVGIEYGAVLGGYYAATKPQDIILLAKYPYQNVTANGKFFWMQTNILGDIADTIMGETNFQVTFKIYVKTPLPCGYPKKCGVMTAKEVECNGVCGLRNFFESTHDIDTLCIEDFDFGAYMSQYQAIKQVSDTVVEKVSNSVKPIIRKTASQIYDGMMNAIGGADFAAELLYSLYKQNFGDPGERAAQYLNIKKDIALWINNGTSLATNTWNVVDALWEMDNVLERVGKIIGQVVTKVFTKELMDLIPPECQKYFCQIQRQRKQDGITLLSDDIDETTMISIDAGLNFLDKSFKDGVENLGNSVLGFTKGVGETLGAGLGAVGTIVQGVLGDIMNKFDFWSLTQYCPRRLSDVLIDINPLNDAPSNGIMSLGNGLFKVPKGINIFDQLGISICQDMIGNIMSLLNNCVTRSITNHNIAYSNLLPEGTRKYLEAANSVGDIAAMTKTLKHRGLTLQNLFHEANRSSILSNFVDIDVDDISLGYVYDELDMRGITNIIDVDDLLPVDKVDQVLQNTINKAISNNNENIQKLKNGEVLSLNDQFNQLVNENYEEKTDKWAKNLSDKVNAVTNVTSNVKGLLDNYDITDPMKIVNNPIDVLNKLNNIQTTIMQEVMSAILNGKEAEQQKEAANGDDEQVKQIKIYIKQREKYLEQLKSGKL